MATDTIDHADKEYGPPLPPDDEEDTDQNNDGPDTSDDNNNNNNNNKEYGGTPVATGPPTEYEAGSRLQTPLGPPGSRQLSGVRTTSTQNTRELARLRRRETRLAAKEANPWQHLGMTLGLPMILLFDVVVPCVIYYTWYRARLASWRDECGAGGHDDPCPAAPPEFDSDILGSAIASFGIGELWILLARVYRLFVHPDVCAPLLSTSRWQLDATSWVYAFSMIVALVPFLVGSTLEIPKLYLYGPSFLMGFLGILMVVSTLHPFNIPIVINSQPHGTPLRPFIYYAAEDFMAVDGLQDREFRTRYNDRYETNPMFRRFFFNLTLWWTLGVCVYIGSVSAVIWTLEFHYAFGLSLGLLFSYIACWAIVTFVWTKIEMKREHEAYERGDFDV